MKQCPRGNCRAQRYSAGPHGWLGLRPRSLPAARWPPRGGGGTDNKELTGDKAVTKHCWAGRMSFAGGSASRLPADPWAPCFREARVTRPLRAQGALCLGSCECWGRRALPQPVQPQSAGLASAHGAVRAAAHPQVPQVGSEVSGHRRLLGRLIHLERPFPALPGMCLGLVTLPDSGVTVPRSPGPETDASGY